MKAKLCCAPCCFGVEEPDHPYVPDWLQVLDWTAQAGYQGLELGPYGYMPFDAKQVGEELIRRSLSIVAGTIFDDLVSLSHRQVILKKTRDLCEVISQLSQPARLPGQRYAVPYLVLIDWGHDIRDHSSGHPDRAPRLPAGDWDNMMELIKEASCIARDEYGVRAVIHPHAGGYIEFEDEIEKVAKDIPYELAGLCLDTGHLHYSGMNPVEKLKQYKDQLDYLHFKDVDQKVFEAILTRPIRFFEAVYEGVMTPIGKGVIDYAAIYRCLEEINYSGYITLEMERDPRHAQEGFMAVRESRSYLQKVGF